MFRILCDQCNTERTVQAKKPWMIGEEPYIKICKSCCQLGKEKTQDHRDKLSASVKAAQTDELLKKKSKFQIDSENWKNNLIAGQGAGWNLGISTGSPSEETKAKISQSMKNRKNKNDTK